MNIAAIIEATTICSLDLKSRLVKTVTNIYYSDLVTSQKINKIRLALEYRLRFNSLEGILKKLF